MKKEHFQLLFLAFMCLSLTSCSNRLVDFTVISSKNASIDADKKKGIATEGSKTYILNLGFNLKDALDNALENAGPEYDLLIDGVVTATNLVFATKVTVKGTAINSRDMAMQLGKEEFENWCKTQNIFDPTLNNVAP